MFIASVRLELSLPHAHSLKENRMAVHSLMDRLRSRFGAAVAEAADQDLWQRAVVGVALVSGETTHVRAMAERAIAFVEANWEGEVCQVDLEIL